jgi:hypothetical protein
MEFVLLRGPLWLTQIDPSTLVGMTSVVNFFVALRGGKNRKMVRCIAPYEFGDLRG